MEVDCKVVCNSLIVRMTGEIDMLVAERLREYIDSRLKDHKIQTLILNLEKITFIDSSGLGVIIGRYKKMSARKGKMYIVGAKKSVEQILFFSGINKLIPMCKNEQEIFNS